MRTNFIFKRGGRPGQEARVYLDEVGAAQRDDLHDALALRERDGGALPARAPQVLPPALHARSPFHAAAADVGGRRKRASGTLDGAAAMAARSCR